MNARDDRTIDAALALHAAGAYDDAERAYRGILEATPDDAEASHYLGVLLHQTGRSEDGVALIVAALERAPDVPARYNDLGNILVQLDNLEEAASVFALSLEFDAHDANVWNNLGSVRQRLGLAAEAETAYRNAITCAPDFTAALENLAALLNATGREVEGAEYWCRSYVLPPLDDKPPKLLATAYYMLGRVADAAECYRRCLLDNPDDPVARHHLAACSGVAVPVRASDRYIAATFDDMAGSFEHKLLGKLNYRGPEMIRDLLAGQLDAERSLDVIDAGCGTGLCAPVLAPYARRLVGVDLSRAMLALARERKVYDALEEDEICAFLQRHPLAFELAALVDTVIYFGDVTVLFGALQRALRPGGMLAFSIEPEAAPTASTDGYRLAPSGRYVHDQAYIENTLAATGFTVQRVERSVVRREFGRDVAGLAVLARRR